MGQLVLEIPQNVNRTFRIESEKRAAEILEQLEASDEKRSKFEKLVASGAIQLPTSKFSDEDDEVLGIWADRPGSAQEIARRIRDRNNGKID